MRKSLPDLETEVLNRVQAIGDPGKLEADEYRDGLRAAVAAALELGLRTVEVGEQRATDIPLILLSQARLAARHRVGVGTMHRRYAAGKHVLARVLRREAANRGGLSHAELDSLFVSLELTFDHLVARLEGEYDDEAKRFPTSSHAQLTARIKQLLAGEPIDTSDLPYDFDGHHVAAVAIGVEAPAAMRDLASKLDAHPLIVQPDDESAWAWLGRRRPICRHQLGRLVGSCWPPGISVGFGEPSQGLSGWRRSHRQARDVAPAAHRRKTPVARYAEDAILAAIERDELLVAFLRKRYIEPLMDERVRDLRLPATLRAYLATGRNGASAAHVLGLSRQTVSNRLKKVEEILGYPVLSFTAEIEIALRLGEESIRRGD